LSIFSLWSQEENIKILVPNTNREQRTMFNQPKMQSLLGAIKYRSRFKDHIFAAQQEVGMAT
jgi:hypothetical protein